MHDQIEGLAERALQVDGAASPQVTLLKTRIEQARKSLLDVGLRNKLVHTNLNAKRTRDIAVWGEDSDQVFDLLVERGRAMTFAPHLKAGEADAAEFLEHEGHAADQTDERLQTRHAPEALEKKLRSLEYEARTIEEEQGVNVLYLALGFLRWFEDDRSEVERFAPLVLLPVALEREGARERFKLKLRDEDLFLNVSLKAKLTEFGIDLPDLPEAEAWCPSEYFAAVAAEVAGRPRWEVRPDVMRLGFFSFSKYLLWKDLDTSAEGALERLCGHEVLRRIFSPGGGDDASIYGDLLENGGERLDDVFAPADLPYVVDADSSQTVAIQEVLSGRNLVIQGPPGTGKSQTITNVIAAAAKSGKRVLFLAEKMAALDVVHDRLRKAGLGALCLELHSNKVSKAHVHAQLRQAAEAVAEPDIPTGQLDVLADLQRSLNAYADSVHRKDPATDLSAYDVVGRILKLRDAGVPSPLGDFLAADAWDADRLKEALAKAGELGALVEAQGPPDQHPFRGAGCGRLTPLDLDQLRDRIETARAAIRRFRLAAEAARARFSQMEEVRLEGVPAVVSALHHVAAAPEAPVEVLSGLTVEGVEQLKPLAVAGRSLNARKPGIAAVLLDDAWAEGWSAERRALAAHGRSIFRGFNRDFRDALAKLRGFAKGQIPKEAAARVALVDELIAAQSERKLLQEAGAAPVTQAGALWRGEASDWDLLDKVCTWTVGALEHGDALVQPGALLNAPSAAAEAQALERGQAEVETSFRAVLEVLQPAEPAAMLDGAARDSWTALTLDEALDRWAANPEAVNGWPRLRDLYAWLQGLNAPWFVAQLQQGRLSGGALAHAIELAVLQRVWRRLRTESTVLAQADGGDLDKLTDQFRVADRRRAGLAALEIAKVHADGRPRGAAGEMGELRNELYVKRRRHYPVRKLVERCAGSLQALKPVFLMSPLSIAQYLPPGAAEFDLLVIDEASQVRPEEALGAISRATQVVVVGDDKQLPPTSFFMKAVNDVEDDDEDLDEDEAAGSVRTADVESILDLCRAFGEPRMLMWHYRSLHPALVAVSNRNFYEGKLKLPPAILRGVKGDDIGLEYVRTPDGGYDRGGTRTNMIEADIVAEAVMDHARREIAVIDRGERERSLGVAAFSNAQRVAIDDCVNRRLKAEPALERFFSRERPEPFFIKNLENIQGDERDEIYISVGYGRDREGRLVQNFGMSSEGSERRLNVLITRARRRCRVFTSISADDVRIEPGRPQIGKKAFKEFLKLAETGEWDVALPTDRGFDSDFEEAVARRIESWGYEVHPQVGERGFFIDLGVVDPREPGRYLLGVECDGAAFHSSKSARDRDRLREAVLRSRGWNIHRVWSTDWFYRTEAAAEKLRLKIEVLLQTPLKREEREKLEKPVADVAPVAEPVVFEAPAPLTADAYEEANFYVDVAEEPHKAPTSVLAAVAHKIVEIEGPIHTDEVARRLASCWNLQRAGSRIVDASIRGLRAAKSAGMLIQNGDFWSNQGTPPKARDRSATASLTVRKAEMLPPAEIKCAAVAIVEHSGAIAPEELVVEIARLLGFARTGPDLGAAIRSAIGAFLEHECEVDQNGRVRLVK